MLTNGIRHIWTRACRMGGGGATKGDTEHLHLLPISLTIKVSLLKYFSLSLISVSIKSIEGHDRTRKYGDHISGQED